MLIWIKVSINTRRNNCPKSQKTFTIISKKNLLNRSQKKRSLLEYTIEFKDCSQYQLFAYLLYT